MTAATVLGKVVGLVSELPGNCSDLFNEWFMTTFVRWMAKGFLGDLKSIQELI